MSKAKYQKKRLWIVVGAFVFVIVGIFCVVLYKVGDLPFIQDKQSIVVITKRNNAFSPSKIRIYSGQTVVFKTQDGKPFWPASNFHPAHTLYSAFDPQKPIEATESWSFRFDRVGTWNYHDHLKPLAVGTIIVLGDSKNECKKLPEGADIQTQIQCWQQEIEGTLVRQGLDKAFEVFARLYDTVPSFRSNCHDVTHFLGEAAYKQFKKTKAVHITEKTSYCGYGFYHGFVSLLAAEKQTYKEAQSFCTYVDEQLSRDIAVPSGIYACYHGFGHALFDSQDYDVWGNEGKMVASAISQCEDLTQGLVMDEYRRQCTTGVFNAMTIAYINSEYGLYMNQKDPFAICRKQQELYQRGCYIEVGVAYIHASGYSVSQAMQFIASIPNKAGASEVMYGYISEAIRLRINESDYSEYILACRNASEELKPTCYSGIAEGLVSGGKPGLEHEKAIEFCHSSELTAYERGVCMENIFRRFESIYSRQKLQNICMSVEGSPQAVCNGTGRGI